MFGLGPHLHAVTKTPLSERIGYYCTTMREGQACEIESSAWWGTALQVRMGMCVMVLVGRSEREELFETWRTYITSGSVLEGGSRDSHRCVCVSVCVLERWHFGNVLCSLAILTGRLSYKRVVEM